MTDPHKEWFVIKLNSEQNICKIHLIQNNKQVHDYLLAICLVPMCENNDAAKALETVQYLTGIQIHNLL